MQKNPLIEEFVNLLDKGVKALNLNLEIIAEENCVIIRDYIIDFEDNNQLYIVLAHDIENPIASFPKEGYMSAAVFVCSNIANNIITRAIEE